MARERKLPSGMRKRGNVYYARFRVNSKLVQERLSTDYRTACEMLNERRARADRNKLGLTDNDYPLAKLKAEFMKWKQQTSRNPQDYERDLKRFEEYAPIGSVCQIDHAYVVGYRSWRLAQDKSPRTVNREVGTLRHMLNQAVEWGRILENPIVNIKPLSHDEKSKERRSLTVEEVEAIFEESPVFLRPVWRMFMTTGIRHEELVDMKFADVDFERQSVTVRAGTAKSHKAREIPLDDEMLETIRTLAREAEHRHPGKGATADYTNRIHKNFSRDHVFVTRAGTPLRNNLLTRFYTICKRAGIEGAEPCGSVDIHSLRVTFTTLALENGAPPKAVQAILGHSTLALTMNVYAKATERSKREAISALPFAKTSSPDNIVSMQNVSNVSASNKHETQPVDTKRLA